VRTLIRLDFQKVFEGCDAIVTPVAPTTAFRLGEKTDDPLTMYLSDIFTISVNLAGLPALVVPAASTRWPADRLQVIGRPFASRRCSATAPRTRCHRLAPQAGARCERARPTSRRSIGLEVHAELLTAGEDLLRLLGGLRRPPNTNVCPVCLGMPGVSGAEPPRRSSSRSAPASPATARSRALALRAQELLPTPDLPKG
jgi:hypothetical protein